MMLSPEQAQAAIEAFVKQLSCVTRRSDEALEPEALMNSTWTYARRLGYAASLTYSDDNMLSIEITPLQIERSFTVNLSGDRP